jgi:hypothetical protein
MPGRDGVFPAGPACRIEAVGLLLLSRLPLHNKRNIEMRRLIAAAFVCLVSPVALAQPQASPARASNIVTHVRTAADLAAVCAPAWSGVPRLEAIAYCQGFLTAAGQYHALAHPAGGRVAPLYCVPAPGPSIAESGLAFAAWTEAHPAHQAEPALDGFLRWAQATFPCPRPTAPRAARAVR